MAVKPGFKTTEFWGKVLGQLGVFVTALAGDLPPDKAAYVILGAEALYGLSRAITKFKSFSPGDIIALIEQVLSQQKPPA